MSAFIVLGVLALCGLIAAIEIIRNRRIGFLYGTETAGSGYLSACRY